MMNLVLEYDAGVKGVEGEKDMEKEWRCSGYSTPELHSVRIISSTRAL